MCLNGHNVPVNCVSVSARRSNRLITVNVDFVLTLNAEVVSVRSECEFKCDVM